MRPGLRWLLAATLLLSALAIWWPQEPSAARPEHAASTAVALVATPSPTSAAPATATLSHRLSTQHLEPARFDPFVGVLPPAPPPPKPAPVVAMPPPPPPAPMAPPLAYRYLGRMIDPSGAQLVYLARAEAAVAVAVGARLEEGYVVEEIGPAGIRLHYPPLDAHAVIPVPPEPEPFPR